MTTINQHISSLTEQFRNLTVASQRRLAKQAREYIAANPAMADASAFWRGLSARQVLSAASQR